MDRRTLTITTALGAVVLTCCPGLARADVASCIAAAEHAQPLRASGHLLEARAALITCAAESCPTTVRTDCVTWLTEVKREIPTLVVQAKNAAGADISDVTVFVDGAPAKPSLDGLPITLDPGSHRLRFESAGRTPVEQQLVIQQGERRALAITLVGPEEPAPANAHGPASAAESSPAIPTISWVLGGASVVLAGTGIALWAVGRGEKSDLESGCGTSSSCAHDDIVASRTKLMVGDVLVGAGVVALGAGLTIALTSRRAAPTLSFGPKGVTALGRF